jgi:hypothetical protein
MTAEQDSIDISSGDARKTMWDKEERVLRDERGAWFSPIRGWKRRLRWDSMRDQYGEAVGTTL